MFEKLKAFYSVFTAGQAVANPAAWKRGQVTGGAVTGLLAALVALAKVLGYDLPLTNAELVQIGGGVVAIFGLFINPAITVATTTKLGLPPLAPDYPVLDHVEIPVGAKFTMPPVSQATIDEAKAALERDRDRDTYGRGGN